MKKNIIMYIVLCIGLLMSSCSTESEQTQQNLPETTVAVVTSDNTKENKTEGKTEEPTNVPVTGTTPLPSTIPSSFGDTTSFPTLVPTLPPSPTPTPTVDNTAYTLRINEVLASGDTVILADGGMYDYIELYNYGDYDLLLDKIYIGDGNARLALNGVTIKKGGYYTVYASDKLSDATQSYKHLPFKISAGEVITLEKKNGEVIDTLALPEDLAENYVISYNGIFSGREGYSWGEYTVGTVATPGYENSISGLAHYYKERDSYLGKLVISEVMTSNSKYAKIKNEYYDWVEIKNISSEKVLLSDYYLTDSFKKNRRHPLPEVELGAGESVIIYATGGIAVADKGYYAPFKLSNDGESLYLFDEAGNISDCAYLAGIPHQGSYGRMNGESGFFYFAQPTPGKDNESGCRLVSNYAMPSVAPGIYNSVEDKLNITFPISDDVKLYYTLDGSIPTEGSILYDGGEISLTKTTIVRACVVYDGRIPSEVETYAYIINEEHTLPVLNIAIDPELMFGENGIYSNYMESIEHLCNLSFYEEGGQFSIDCGIELTGADSRKMDKKSFRVKFRGKYGESSLVYDIFGGGEVTEFKSIRLRAGEDTVLTMFGDELTAELASQCIENALYQSYRWCVLYINGEYYGIYAIRTDTKEEYLAEKYGVDTDDVNLLSGWADPENGRENGFKDLVDYVVEHDMSDPEHYQYICDRIDIDSLIDWLFIQSFTGNKDTINVRYYQVDNGKWKWILYDFDWAYRNKNNTMFIVEVRGNQYSGIFAKQLFENEDFLDRYLTTYGKRLNGVFSPENVLAEIDKMFDLLKDEAVRDRKRWDIRYSSWTSMVESMKKYVSSTKDFIIDDLKDYFDLSDSQIEKYFS